MRFSSTLFRPFDPGKAWGGRVLRHCRRRGSRARPSILCHRRPEVQQPEFKGSLLKPIGNVWEERFWSCQPIADYSIINRDRMSLDAADKHQLIPHIRRWKTVDLNDHVDSQFDKHPFSPRLQDLRFCLEAIEPHLDEFKPKQEDAPVAFVLQRFTSLGLCHDASNFERENDVKDLFVSREGNLIMLWKDQKDIRKDSCGSALERLLVQGGLGENFRVVRGNIGHHVLFCAGEVDAWEGEEPIEIKCKVKDESIIHDYFQCVNIGIKTIWSQGRGMRYTKVDRMEVPLDVKHEFHLNLNQLLDQLVHFVHPGQEYKLTVGPEQADLYLIGQATLSFL